MTSRVRTLIVLAVVMFMLCLALGQSAAPSPTLNSTPNSSLSAEDASPVLMDSTQLEVISSPPPYFPLAAAVKGILRGNVVIQLHISETGVVDSTDISSGDPVLAQAAAAAMLHWKFKPFIKAGRPVRVSRKVPYEMVLEVNSQAPCAAVEAAIKVNEVNPLRGYISPDITAGKRVHGVDPVYPAVARTGYIQGDVVLRAWIDNQGRVTQLKSLCGPKELVPASLDAVRQWRFSPFLDHGAPAAALTMITVSFRM